MYLTYANIIRKRDVGGRTDWVRAGRAAGCFQTLPVSSCMKSVLQSPIGFNVDSKGVARGLLGGTEKKILENKPHQIIIGLRLSSRDSALLPHKKKKKNPRPPSTMDSATSALPRMRKPLSSNHNHNRHSIETDADEKKEEWRVAHTTTVPHRRYPHSTTTPLTAKNTILTTSSQGGDKSSSGSSPPQSRWSPRRMMTLSSSIGGGGGTHPPNTGGGAQARHRSTTMTTPRRWWSPLSSPRTNPNNRCP